MNDEMTIEKMIMLLLYTADRLESYITDGIPVYDPNLIVGEDYRVDSAETRIDDYKRKIDKDKKQNLQLIWLDILSIIEVLNFQDQDCAPILRI